ncbi:MAG: ATP-binding protein [Enterocloster aldenensis]|nr:ATP-binding protein [Enterocloster aldenensis]
MDIHNIVLIGEAGSGKTEIAANIAILLAEKDEKPVYLIDMDQTKCLFRARDFSYYRKVLAEIKLCKLMILPKEGIENRR